MIDITILDIYGSIENKILISKKLGLTISNVKDSDWKIELIEEIKNEINDRARAAKRINSEESRIQMYNLKKIFTNSYLKDVFIETKDTDNEILKLVESLTCLYVDDFENTMLTYRNEYIESPTCEICFEKKFMNFYSFVVRNAHRNQGLTVSSIITYCSDDFGTKSRIVSSLTFRAKHSSNTIKGYESYENERVQQVNGLVKFGEIIDSFIESTSDFFLLEYIMNALDETENYNAYYIFKLVSIIELLIKNPKHTSWHESDYSRLARFIYNSEDKMRLAHLIVQIRNKIGHGDYKALHRKAEEYAEGYMKDYNFDYWEMSRINWIYSYLSCTLNEILSEIIWEYLNNKSLIENHKLI